MISHAVPVRTCTLSLGFSCAEYTARYASADQMNVENGHGRGDESMSDANSEGSFLSSSDDDDEEDEPTTGIADMP